jgi:transcription antitermination factor NusG
MDGTTPARLADAIICELKARERDGFIELPKKQGLRPGDRVRVVAGPLQNHFGFYVGQKPRERVEILLSLLGSPARPVTMGRQDVQAAAE